MLDLGVRGHDVRALVHGLENWVIACLADCGVTENGVMACKTSGLKPATAFRTDKIAAIGIGISRWVSWHGQPSIRPRPAPLMQLSRQVRDSGVTSLAALGVDLSMAQLDDLLRSRFSDYF